MSKCPINGDAEVTIDLDRNILVWFRADPEVHVHDEVLDNEVARRRLETKYEVIERCPHGKTTWHARRRSSGRAFDLAAVEDVARSGGAA